MIIAVVMVGCGEKKPLIRNHIEEAIREKLEKPEGELTKADYEKVTELYLANNQLTDVTGLEKLTQLKDLSIVGTQVTDVRGLEKLTKLERLELQDNQLTSVKGLENLTQLETLALDDNKLTSVKGLEKLTQLIGLTLENNPDLTKAQIAELQKALPKCDIYSNPKK
jgi:internalin A